MSKNALNTCRLRYHIRSAVILLILFSSSVVFGQNNELIFEQIFLQHGLSQSIVNQIMQDRTGFIWIATEDGLNKFDGYEFKVFRNDPENANSLSYNQVNTLYEDKDGIIWLGTFYGGLERYDPNKNKFVHYLSDPADQTTLSHNNVNVIREDSEGCLWIGTENGLNRFDRTTGKFTRFISDVSGKNSLSDNTIRALCTDAEGNLWIGTKNGLNRLSKKTNSFTIFRNEPGNSGSLSSNEVQSLYCDKLNNVWVGTRGGGLNKLVQSLNKETSPSFIRYINVPNETTSISNNDVYAIYEDAKGTLWIGTNGGGVNIFHRETNTFTNYIHDPLNSSSISINEIRSVFEDKSGLVWIGTYGGGINLVNRGRKNFNLYHNIPGTVNSLNQNIVWSIYEDSSGILWIGTHGGGLNRLDRSNKVFRHYLHDPADRSSLNNNIVRLVFEDRAHNFWIGTNGGGLSKFDRTSGTFISFVHSDNDAFSISHNELRSIYQDRAGTIWIGTNGGGLNKMEFKNQNYSAPKFTTYRNIPDDPNSLSNDFVRVIYEDNKGYLWIGTQGGGLNKFDREKNIFKHYRANKDDPKSISNDYIFAIYQDSKRRIWLGTWGGGLIEFDAANETFRNYTTKSGLPSDAIYGMLDDGEGMLWLSTNNGLVKFHPDEKSFKNYKVSDGLQSNEFNGGAFFKSRNGELFFGGIGGFNSFFPEEIKDNPHIPPVVITSFKKLNREISFDTPINAIDKIELFSKDYLFSFEYASLDFNSPHKNQYAYMMEGLDENWISTTADKRYAVYTTLAPGRYVFRVKGSNNDGVWNENGASIVIIINPPFWRTWWFIVLCLLILGGILYLSLRRRMTNVRLVTELRAAHEAQMSIMPQKDPEIDSLGFSASCIPASEVGGDFFDYLWLDEGKTKLGIVIGDVSGKGMKSAMNAVMCSGMITSLVYDKYSVKEIMTRVNRSLFSKTERKMFTALCFAIFDLETRELVFTNAGLNHPLVKSNGKVSALQSVGPKYPLGGFADTEYGEQNHRMKQGDILLFSSDGITEAQNREKELYGVNSLISLLESLDTERLSAEQIKTAIIESVKRFTAHTDQSDDMTLIVIKML